MSDAINYTILIFDMSGRLIVKTILIESDEVKVEDLLNGAYLCILLDEKNEVIYKKELVVLRK